MTLAEMAAYKQAKPTPAPSDAPRVITVLAGTWWIPDALYGALAERAQRGRETYGTDLHARDERPTVVDFVQETLDSIMYGTKRRMQVRDLRRRVLWALLVVNQAIVTWIAGRWG